MSHEHWTDAKALRARVAELEREARRFYVAPHDSSGMTPRRGSGA